MNGQEPSTPDPQPARAQPGPFSPLAELIGVMKSVLWSAGFISFMAVLVLSIVIVLAMTPEIQQWITTPVPSDFDPATLVLPREFIFIITPWPVLLFSLEGAGFQAWHLIMLGILVWAFALAKYDLFSSWLSGRGAAARSLLVPEKASSSLEGTAKLFMASISFSMVYFIILGMISVETQTPDFKSLSRPELIYGLFNASVFEELISRVLLIGLPLAVIGTVRGWKRPAGKLLGGGLDLTPITFSLIIFSSVMFAFAHVGSWDLWKVPQVLVTGMALGWAFVRYGLHASILIHFVINLSSSAMHIWPDSDLLTMLLGIVIVIWMVAGGYFFMHYCIGLWLKFVPGKQPAIRQDHVPPPPQWQGQGNVQQPPVTDTAREARGFICPNCGHTGATYDSDRLICLRCGTAHYRNGTPTSAPEKEQIEL